MLAHVDNRITYSGNGNATEFAYQFKILDRTDIKVMLTDADGKEKLLTKDYYVDVEKSVVRYPGYAVGAEVPESERPAALPTGWKLTIYREVPVTQETDLPNQYPFNQVEDIGDKLTMIAQQLTDTTGRSLKIGVSKSTDIDTVIQWENGKSFRISDDGKTLELSEDPAKVLPLAQGVYTQTQAQAQSAAASARLAEDYKNAAETAKNAASLYATNAKNSAGEAKTYMDNAKRYSENVNVFTPSVSSDGVLSWTNKAGLPNPASVNIKGAKGDKGDTGAQGIQGVKGDKGDTGEQGLQGVKGDKGDTGERGPQGLQGATGATGAAGTAATIKVGTVSTGNAGSAVSVTNSGTSSEVILNFVIPKGDKGDQGQQGDIGLQGPPGPQGMKGATGAAGTAATIKIGTVTTGAAGTEAQVTNSGTTSAAVLNFTIPQGAKGEQGEKGEQGSGASGDYLPLTGGTVTGGITASNFQTGTAAANYFQCRRFRGEGDADTYYHAVDFGCSGHDSVDFYEYNASWNFYQCTTGTKSGAVLVGNINGNGWNGSARLTGTPTAPTAATGTNTTQIATTEFVQNSLGSYVKTVNNTAPDENGNVNISTSSGGVSTSTQNSWTALQSFDLALLSVEKYKTVYANGNSVKPSSVTAVYNATGSFTLDLNNFSDLLSAGQSLVFTAYIKANADYPLTITNGGTLKYIGSPSDLAITSAGLLLNILIMLDSSSNKTSIVQASKLS